jgi:hypothetical protein
MLYKTHVLSVLNPRKKRVIGSESGEGQAMEVNCLVEHTNHMRHESVGQASGKYKYKVWTSIIKIR